MLYEIALTLIDGIGNIHAKNILAHCGAAEAVFKEKGKNLLKIPRIGPVLAGNIQNTEILARAGKELEFMTKNNIRALFYQHSDYPSKLKHCDDCPVILYTKGNAGFNAANVVSIVGTRSSTPYGTEVCETIVKELALYKPVIASGLALGIDSTAHLSALANGLETWAAVGHSLDTIYPASNRKLAADIARHGAVISEYVSGTKPDKEHFPMRNRIVAGLADVTIVVETAEKGGSMITAELASGYSRDVFAVPGRITEPTFTGCHKLIQENKAMIFTSADHLAREMGWKKDEQHQPVQASLLLDLSPVEETIVNFLKQKIDPVMIDQIGLNLKIPVSKLNSELLSMELKGIVKALPGKRFGL